VDATDTNTALIARGGATQVTRAFARQVGAMPPEPSIRTVTRLWFNPGREPEKFFGPGMFVLALSIFPTVLAALAMSREGEQQTILQVYVSSISAHEFAGGEARGWCRCGNLASPPSKSLSVEQLCAYNGAATGGHPCA
jgi:ABC-2 type transport system permease protein